MKILDIKNPEFLKVLSIDEMVELAADIRQYMIEAISRNGGQLSSNLSIVELTIALHATFNMPIDKLIFDTAYQCYAHKILTGRAKEFKNIRRHDGLSGFFNPLESEYDTLAPTLSSNNLKAIEGLTYGEDQDSHIVIVIDNESIDNGDTFEALIRLSNLNRKVIVVYNDTAEYNQKNHTLSNVISKISNNARYVKVKNSLDDMMSKNKAGEELRNNLINVKLNLKEHLLNMPKIFEELNLNYIGPVDGHDIFALLKALKKAKLENESCFVHVKTIRGKGLNFIESGQKLDTCLCKPFDAKTGKDLVDTPKDYFSFNTHLSRYLELLMERFKDLYIISTENIFDLGFMQLYNKYKERFIYTNNNPDSALEIARGMAYVNLRPIVLIEASKLSKGYDAYLDIVKNQSKVIICVYNAGLKAYVGNDFQGVDALSIETLLNDYPITFASDLKELEILLVTAYHSDKPYVINYSEGIFKYENRNVDASDLIWDHLIKKEDNLAYLLTYGRSIKMFSDDINLNDLKLDLINLVNVNQLDNIIMDEMIASKKAIIIYEEARSSILENRIKAYLYDKHATNEVYSIKIEGSIETGSLSSMRQALDYTTIFKKLGIYD